MEKWAYRILPQYRGGRDSYPQLEMESARRRAGREGSKRNIYSFSGPGLAGWRRQTESVCVKGKGSEESQKSV